MARPPSKSKKDPVNKYVDIIQSNFKVLKRSLDPTDELLAQFSFMWPGKDIKGTTPNAKSVSLWTTVLNFKSEEVDEFLALLREIGQDHVANVLNKSKINKKVTMTDEHVSILDNKCGNLCQFIDPKGRLVDVLMSKDVFLGADKDRVYARGDDYDEMGDEIIQILKRKSDCCFQKFIDALNETQQNHVAYILHGGGDPPVCSRDIERLNDKLSFITERLEPVRTGLLEQLVSLRAFTDRDDQRVRVEKTDKAQSAKLLFLIKRKSQKSFDQLNRALELSNQKYIAVELFGPTVNGLLHAKYKEGLSQDKVDLLEEELQGVIINEHESPVDLRRNGITTVSSHGSIKLAFTCQTMESLHYLQQLHDGNELSRLLTEKYCPKFADKGLESLKLVITPDEFERCKIEFTDEIMMSQDHYQALHWASQALADKILVSDDLLQKLHLCKNRIKAITDEKIDASRSSMLLTIVSHLADREFRHFIVALNETGQTDVATAIMNAATKLPTPPVSESAEDLTVSPNVIRLGYDEQELEQHTDNAIPGVNDYVNLFYGQTQNGHILLDGISKFGTKVHMKTSDEDLLICQAAENGQIDTIINLLNEGSSIDTKDFLGRSLLWLASANNHFELVKFLEGSGCKVTTIDNNGASAVYIAAQQGHADIVRFLIQHGADALQQTVNKQSPLSVSSALGHTSVVDILLKKIKIKRIKFTIHIDSKDFLGRTPLWFAASCGHKGIVDLLLKHDADAGCMNINNITALYAAVLSGNVDIVKALMQHNADANTCAKNGSSPLGIAYASGRMDIVSLLYTDKCTINKTTDQFSKMPVYGPWSPDSLTSTNVIAAVQQRISITFTGNASALPVAVYATGTGPNISAMQLIFPDNKSVLAQMLASSKQVIQAANVVNNFENCGQLSTPGIQQSSLGLTTGIPNVTPLHIASNQGHIESARAFVNCSSDILNARDPNGKTALALAAERGHTEIVKMLLEKDAALDIADNSGQTPLLLSVINGRVDTVGVLLSRTALSKYTPTDSALLLYFAINNNSSEIASLLVANGIDVNAKTAFTVSPLGFAAEKGLLSIVKLLLEKRAIVDIGDAYDRTPLWFASANGHTDVIEALIESNADVHMCNRDGFTPLHIAAYQGKIKSVKLLIESKANVNAQTNVGLSPLNVAAVKGHFEVVQLLLDHEVIVNGCDGCGVTPLMNAASCVHKRTDIIELLIRHGADVNAYSGSGLTALTFAAMQGHVHNALVLLENGAITTTNHASGVTPLWYASNRGLGTLVHALLANGADVDTDCIYAPLYIAAHNQHPEIVKTLLKHGASVDIHNLIITAAMNGHQNVAEMLLQNGAKTEAKDDDTDRTALWFAAANGHANVAKLLLVHRAIVDVADKAQSTPLHVACQNGRIEVVRILLKAKANVDALAKELSSIPPNSNVVESHAATAQSRTAVVTGFSPLAIAARHGRVDVVKELLNNKAKVDQTDSLGMTPLFHAVESGNAAVIEALVAGGADVNWKADHDVTPLCLAALRGNLDVTLALLTNGADVNIRTTDGDYIPTFADLNKNTAVKLALLSHVGQIH